MPEYLIAMFHQARQGETQGIYFYIVVYSTVVLTMSLVYQIRINRWPTVKGQILESGVNKIGGIAWATTDQNYVAEALYQYEVGGQVYCGKR